MIQLNITLVGRSHEIIRVLAMVSAVIKLVKKNVNLPALALYNPSQKNQHKAQI